MVSKTRAWARGRGSVAKGRGDGLGEALALWTLFGLDAVAVFATYSRVSPSELYHVSEDGITGGAGRVLVYLNYPVALAAIALVAVAVDRLDVRRWAAALGVVSVALCSLVVVPGVVDQGDLDAKPVNVLPATGVLLALALAGAATRAHGYAFAPPQVGDSVRLALGGALALLATPWVTAELGVFAQRPWLASKIPAGEELAAVHHGHHHGLDGVLFAVTALLLSRTLVSFRRDRLRRALSLYLALMLVYGLANAAQDAWLEQVVKRGWIEWEFPPVLRPDLTPAWAVIVLATLAVWVFAFRRFTSTTAR